MNQHSGILILFLMIMTFAAAVLNAAEVAVSAPAQAAKDTSLYRIETRGGAEFIGRILEESESLLRLRTPDGITVDIPVAQIKTRRRLVGRVIHGRLFRPDPNHTRLLFAPTARSLKRGRGYLSVYQIFFPMLSMGITDYLALSGGISLFPGASQQLSYFAPKVNFLHKSQYDLGGGVLFLKIPEEDLTGIVYSLGTFGNHQSAFTAGVGFGFSGDKVAKKPIFLLGGELRLSPKTKLISENWFLPEEAEVNFLSLGIRFFGENLAADFALIYPAGSGISGFPFFPWVGFAYNFGYP